MLKDATQSLRCPLADYVQHVAIDRAHSAPRGAADRRRDDICQDLQSHKATRLQGCKAVAIHHQLYESSDRDPNFRSVQRVCWGSFVAAKTAYMHLATLEGLRLAVTSKYSELF